MFSSFVLLFLLIKLLEMLSRKDTSYYFILWYNQILINLTHWIEKNEPSKFNGRYCKRAADQRNMQSFGGTTALLKNQSTV